TITTQLQPTLLTPRQNHCAGQNHPPRMHDTTAEKNMADYFRKTVTGPIPRIHRWLLTVALESPFARNRFRISSATSGIVRSDVSILSASGAIINGAVRRDESA